MEKIIAGLAILIAASTGHIARAQAFSGTYTFTGTNGVITPFPYNGTKISKLTVGALGRTNLPVSSSSGNFRSTGFALDPVAGSLTGTVDTNKYFDFSLTAAPGYSFNMTNLNFGFGRSSTGPRTLQWRSSIDGFAAAITNYTSLGVSGLFTNSNGVLTFLTDTSATTGVAIQLGFPVPAYQALTAVTFRCYMYNAETTGGSGGLQGPFTFSGTMIRPVGPFVTWTGDGTTGTWEAGQPGKFGAAYTNDLAADVTFAGTGDVVTVNGNIQAGALNVSAPGYVLNGGSIELGFGSITVTSGLATINTAIGGDSDLIKAGSGNLKLGGANTFTGTVIVSEGTLEVSDDANLGAPGNDLSLNGTIKTVGDVTLGAGRDLSGNVVFDIPPGATLTISGSVALVSTTINGGTLDLRGPVSSLGNIILNGAATIRAPAGVNATQIDASGLTNGTATIFPDITFSSGTKTVNVSTGGVLVLEGAIHNNTNAGFFVKTGGGTLHLKGPCFMEALRIGEASAPSVFGGTVVIYTNVLGRAVVPSAAIQLNRGTLHAATAFTGAYAITNGISIGGEKILNGSVAAVISGENIECKAGASFFRGTGTIGDNYLLVFNTTTFNGLRASAGAGAGTGITIGGTGTVVMAGSGSAMGDTITLTDVLHFNFEGGTIGGNLNVGPANVLGGEGTMGGSLYFASGAKLVFNPTNTIFVNGPSVTFGGFAVNDLIGLSGATANGVYEVFAGLATINTNNLINFSPGNLYDLGRGKYAYFSVGSLELNVVGTEGLSNLVHFSKSSAVMEENAGTTNIFLINELGTGPVSGELVLGGTATPGVDYTISTTNFSMNGITTNRALVSISIIDDAVFEGPTETITLTITNVVGGSTEEPATFTLTINPSDVPVFAPDAVWINEINHDPPGSGSNEFIEVAGPAWADLSCYQIVLYNGFNGLFYDTRSLTGTLVDQGCGLGASSFSYSNRLQYGAALVHIRAGITTTVQFLSFYGGTITANDGPASGLTSTDIGVSQYNEIETAHLAGFGTNYAAFVWVKGAASPGVINPAQITMLNFNAATATVAEASGAYTALIFKATSACSATGDLTGEIRLSGTATAGVDYTIATNFLIAGGNTSAFIAVTMIDDGQVESNETVVLSMANLSDGGVVTPGTFTLNIGNDDSLTLSFATNAAAVSETNTSYDVVVSKNGSIGSVTAQVAIAGTATDLEDYSLSTTNIVLDGANTSMVVAISILKDLAVEPNETIVLTLTNITGGVIGTSSIFTLTISDNDSIDSDGDGMSDEREILAGTNPNDATSVLRLTSFQQSTNLMTLEWSAITGRSYRLERTLSLLFPEWSLLQTLEATSSVMRATDPEASSNYFYRVGVRTP